MLKFPPKPMRGWPNTPLHKRLIEDENWIAEPKKDGERCIVVSKDGKIKLWSRRANLLEHVVSDLINQIQLMLSDLNVILDGELINKSTLWLFDIPSYQILPLKKRKSILSKIYKESPDIHLIDAMKKETAYEDAIESGEEGVVFKDLRSRYKIQFSPENKIVEWIKFKPAKEW